MVLVVSPSPFVRIRQSASDERQAKGDATANKELTRGGSLVLVAADVDDVDHSVWPPPWPKRQHHKEARDGVLRVDLGFLLVGRVCCV